MQPAPPLAGIRIVAVEQYGAGPMLNGDQRAILADLGYDAAAIADLAAAGAFGNHPVAGH